MRLWQKASLMTVDELKNLSEKDLRSYTRSAVNSARERARELEQAGLTSYSEAYRAMQKGGKKGQGIFTTSKKKTRLELMRELNRSIGFLNAKTSTIEGAERRRQWMIKKFGTDDWEVVGPILDRYHEIMNENSKLAQKFRDFVHVLDSDRAQDVVAEYKDSGTLEDMVKALRRMNREDKKKIRHWSP